MNKGIIKVAVCAIMSLILLAGCTNSGIVLNAKEAIQDVASTVEHEVGVASEKSTGAQDGKSKSITVQGQVQNATTLKINHPIGNITVEAAPGSGDKVTVEAVVRASDVSLSSQKIKEILEQADVSVQVNGNEILIFPHPQNDDKQLLWTWAEKQYNFTGFAIDYKVKVPTSIKVYDITNNVGNITLQDIKGQYNLHSDVGLVTIDGAKIEGNSSITAEAGSLRLDIAGIEPQASLDATAEVGSIQIGFEKSVQCNLTVATDIGSVKGVASGTSQWNGGGPQVKLSTSIGSIKVESNNDI